MTSLGDVLVGKIGDVVFAQLGTITNAIGSIISFLQTNVMANVASLSVEILTSVLSILYRFLRVDNLIEILIQKVLGQVFALAGHLTSALAGVLKPVVGT